ncbi:MAG: hypothetical protein CVV44_14895 [Spirochaetae bacterium HGW-Spirochaetae-1]|jgi:hypothetical protein|nr:MAG: hypothetical protein CVV44_14895 [Spirochaetae bacterium HGW-Spirochaetae-1]
MIKDINVSDEYFRISRNAVSDDLLRSVREYGILQSPVLLKTGSGECRIIDGFNRLKAASLAGIDRVEAHVSDRIELQEFIANAVVKSYHNELGPAGKMKVLFVMKDYFNASMTECLHTGTAGLGIPRDFISTSPDIQGVFRLPQVVREYFDARDLSFKIIKYFLRLPEQAQGIMAQWLCHVQLRVNVFKKAVEMIQDIYRRDGTVAWMEKINPTLIDDPRGSENYILEALHRIRYPEYASLWADVEVLLDSMKGQDLEIKFPEFFEGDAISVVLKIRRDETYADIKKKMQKIDQDSFDKLLRFL